MDSTQKLIEKLVERRMQNTGESQAVATANVLAARIVRDQIQTEVLITQIDKAVHRGRMP